jgi:uncharacterized integral membrane protein
MPRIRRPASDAGNTTAPPGVPGTRQYEEPATAPLSEPAPAGEGTPPQPAVPPAAPPAAPPPGPGSAEHMLERTRLGGTWVAIGCFAVVLLFLLIFIVANSNSVDVSYFGAHGHLPLGVALLLAAVCGALLVVLAGMARILQLRSRARRHARAQRQAAAGSQPAS